MRQADIYIRVFYAISSYQILSCLTVPAVDAYVLQTNNSNIPFLIGNINNIFVTSPVAVLKDTVRNGRMSYTRIIRITADLSTTGLYFALRGHGSCFWLFEVTVFYPVCDAVSLEFGANFSKMGHPGDTSSGVCFGKMAISLNPLKDTFNAKCTVTSIPSQIKDQLYTNWIIDDNALRRCMCQPGYEFSNSNLSTSQCRGMHMCSYIHVYVCT